MSKNSMKRTRKVKILFLNEWEIEEQEAWFMDMAKEGWLLENLGLWTATFVEAAPQEINYRIEITKKNRGLEEERIQLYDDAGWDYVTSRRFVYVFREKKANEAIEIHTDSAVQAESIEILKKSILHNGIAVVLLTLFILSLRIFLFNNLSSYDLLRNQILSEVFIIILYVYIVSYWVSGMIYITSLIKKLRKGIGLQRNHKYKRKINRTKVVGFIFILLSVAAILLAALDPPRTNPETMYPKIPAGELPVISLTDVENIDLAQVTYEVNGIERKRDNHFAEDSSILVPKQFKLHQQFIIPGQMWNDSEEKYQPAIYSKKYEALTVGIAEKLVDVLLEEQDEPDPFIETQMTGFDEYWIKDDGYYIIIIARAEKRIYDINYFGNVSIKDLNQRVMELENAN